MSDHSCARNREFLGYCPEHGPTCPECHHPSHDGPCGWLVYSEGYARTDTKDPADNHHGPLSMYLNAGFHVDREDGRIAVLVKSLMGSTPSREVDHD